MANRRALIEGLNPDEDIDLDPAEEFIAGRKPRKAAKPAAPAPKTRQPEFTPPHEADPLPAPPALPRSLTAHVAPATSPLTGVGRVPVGARVRTELAAALKRASLERQLQGIQPNSMQDILEEALELWLHKHGIP